LGHSAAAQAPLPREGRAVPRDAYFTALAPFYAGQYKTALRAFGDAASGGVRSTEGRWVDSICYHTMIAECYYHMGDLASALEQHEAALKLFLAHRDWMLNVEFPLAIGPSASTVRGQVNWGASARRSQLGQLPDTMLSRQGRVNNDQVLRGGGVIVAPQLFPLRVTEVVRCIALSLYRRNELLGPACAHDPLTAQLVTTLSGFPAPPNHWSQRWIDAQLGLAYAGAGKTAEAIQHLQRSLLIGEEFDHPLTGIALLELGRLALAQGQLDAASSFFLEASLAAAQFLQADVVEESFRYGLISHLVAQRAGAFAPLALAGSWAHGRRLERLQAATLLLASESAAVLGQRAEAGSLLEQADRIIRRRDMSGGDIGARLQIQAALVHFQAGNRTAGEAAVAKAIAYMRGGSLRLFQIAMVDNLLTQGVIQPRVANLLFADVLREPTAHDWTTDPLEALAVELTPHPLPLEHWFEAALERKEFDNALVIADQLRRHRFYSSLPFGSRLLALRWIVDAPEGSLHQAALLQRQDLLVKYPQLKQLQQHSRLLRQSLEGLPAVPEDPQQLEHTRQLTLDWAKTCGQLETLLVEIAVRREPSETVFPPVLDAARLREALGDGQAVLAYVATSRAAYGLLVTNKQISGGKLPGGERLPQRVSALLRGLGNYDRNQLLSAGQLNESGWQADADALSKMLLGPLLGELGSKITHLVVVPDGALWYVPFEALPLPARGGLARPLLSQVRLRYVPTVSLALPAAGGRRPEGRTVIVAGQLFPRDEDEWAREAATSVQDVLPPAAALLDTPLPADSRYASRQWNRLIVLDDIDDPPRGPFQWAPAQVDQGKPGSRLLDWMELPWGSPDQIVLPGFHTAAESGLRRREAGVGDDLFLPICGLMASGTRTILISRWRPGGQTCYDLVREFVQELPHATAANAWQRSVQLAVEAELDPLREPRIKLSASDGPPRADHPFFWASYLLVDCGVEPHEP